MNSHQISKLPNRTVVTSFASTSTPSSSNDYDDGHYILHVANSKETTTKPLFSCALSNQTTLTYDRETLKKVHCIDRCHEKTISDLSYTQINNAQDVPILVTSGLDGTVKLFDLRTNCSSSNGSIARGSLELKIPDHEALSVSIGYQGALAAVGGSKGNVHFFDLRNASSCNGDDNTHYHKPLGTYVDAHTEEVTKVRFQNVVGSKGYDTTALLVSAGEDGLACIHDTSQPTEEAALKSVLNVQSPLRDVNFFGPFLEGVYCLTGSETMSVWHHDSAQRMCEYGDIRNTLSTNSGIEINYLVGCCWDSNLNQLNLLAGNTKGDSAIFQVEANSIGVKRVLAGGHKSCIRAFALSSSSSSSSLQTPVIITAGEDSRFCEWNLLSNTSSSQRGDGDRKPAQSTLNVLPKQGGGRIRKQKTRRGHNPY